MIRVERFPLTISAHGLGIIVSLETVCDESNRMRRYGFENLMMLYLVYIKN